MKNYKKSILKMEIILIITALSLSSVTIVTGINKHIETKDYDLLITRSDRSGLEFTLSTNIYSFDTIEVDGKTFDRLHIKNGGYTSEYGKAELPVISFYVAVPQKAEVNLNYILSDYKILDDYYILPSQPPKPETGGYDDPPFTINDSFYNQDEYYPRSVVDVSPVVIMRGCRMVRVSVYPFVYNPHSQTLKFYNNIDIEIEFIGGNGEFIPDRYRSIYFQPIFDSFVINSNMIERAMPQNPQTLSKNSDRADLLIVVYDPFYEEILPLAEWRHLSGIETKVVNWSEIGTTALDLRNYMTNAYNNWELPPSFLLIVGDADQIPVNYLNIHPYHGTPTGTDLWYTAVNGTDYLPEIHAGRISVENENELNIVVNKILDYSKTPYMDVNWFDDILLAAKQESGRYFVYTSERVYNYLNPAGYTCNRQYQGTTPPGSTQGVIDAINNGVIIANHRDHGAAQNDGYSYTGWSGPQFDTTNIPTLTNGRMYPVMFSLNCDSGWFDGETDLEPGNYESIGEVGLRVENKGFVAVLASTRVSYSGYNDEFCCGLFDGMWPNFDPNYPNGGSSNPFTGAVYRISQVMNYGKFWMYDKYIVPGGCSPYPWSPDYAASRATFEEFHVFGDPTMEVWTQMPEDLDVTYNVLSGNIEIIVENTDGDPVEGALVCIYQQNGLYEKGVTDASGIITLSTSQASAEQVTLTVTAHNYLYHQELFYLNRAPEIPQKPTGPETGKLDQTYNFQTTTTDFEGDQIFYKWDWGDGTYSDWLGPFNSGAQAQASHAWNQRGPFFIKVKAKDIMNSESDWSEPFRINIDNVAPSRPWITGKRIGAVGTTYEYSFKSTDPNGDDIYYLVEWGDGTSSGWTGPYNSGYKLVLQHTFEAGDTYTIRAMAKDIFDEYSEWASIQVIMSYNMGNNMNTITTKILSFPSSLISKNIQLK